MSVLVIAEAGVNHNGQLGLALRLIAEAARAGADYVKFQTFITSESIARQAPKTVYQKSTTDPGESQYDMVRKLELSREDHLVLVDACRQSGIGFLSTAFDRASLDMLLELGLDHVKVPSGEITNLPLLRQFGRTGTPVLLSTGMATLGEIEAAIEVLIQSGTPRNAITVLHCSTEYPTPMEEVNLRAMRSLGEAFQLPVGYSDHTRGIEVAIAAVALGASVIEKHFTLDRNLPGPDHQASLEPDELKAMVDAIRNIEVALGDGVKRPTPSELRNKAIARKSLVAARPIRAGEPLSPENLAAKRPGTGISPMLWDSMIGRRASRDYSLDEMIEP